VSGAAELPDETRRASRPLRFAARAGLAALALLALATGLVCARDGNAPADEAARLVPASALVYVHLSTDPDREPDARLARLAAALPAVGRLREQIVAGVSPERLDLERDVRPWLGAELAYAVVSATDSLVLAAVADRSKAQALVARIGARPAGRYRGVPLRQAGPTAFAFVGGFLAAGSEAAVRAAVDREAGAGDRLADLPAYRRAFEDRPAGRSVDAYASATGVRDVLAPLEGPLGTLAALIDRPGLTAAGATLTAQANGLRARVRLAGGAPRDAAFEPVLLEHVPEGAVAYVGLRGVPLLVRVLGRLGAQGPFDQLGASLAGEAGIEFERDLLDPLAGELALAVTGGARGGAPVVTLKARTVDPRRTEAALARLQEPLARRLAVPGTVPAFEPVEIGGLAAFTLPVSPALAPTYAVAGDSIVISTAPAGLEPPRGTLAAGRAFEATIGKVPEKADSLVLLDLRALFALGEQTGLTAIPGLATARDDLNRVRAAGAVITEDPAHPSDTTAELFLEIP
jgi:hypothetical protein